MHHGGGSDVSTLLLAGALREQGHRAVVQAFGGHWRFAHWRLRLVRPPRGTQIVVVTTESGFAFMRPGLRSVAVDRLFVLDPDYMYYRSLPQAIYHETLVRRAVSRSLRQADVVVSLSESSARSVHKMFPDIDPTVIPNGVDTDFFTPAPEPPTSPPADRVRVLFIGNLRKRKGADLLVPIMEELGPAFELAYTSRLSTSRRLPDRPNLICLGGLSQTQVRDALRAADVLLLPTRLEGMPRVALEAFACATPVVATAVSSLPEVIDDGVTGRLCARDDVGAFVSAIHDVTRDPVRLLLMGKSAREVAITRFSLTTMTRRFVQLFEGLLADGGEGGIGSG